MSQGPFLLVVTRDGKSETHAFHQDVVTIGRSRECDLYLPDRLISRLHCRVERLDGAFVLVDAGAQNPAKMRGRPVLRAELKVGEGFALGNYEIALAMWERGFYVRWGGDTLQFAPPFVAEKSDLDALFNTLNDIIPTVA